MGLDDDWEPALTGGSDDLFSSLFEPEELGPLGMLFGIASIPVCLYFLFSLVWMMVDAFRTGEIFHGIFMLCCNIVRWHYIFAKYEGPAKGFFVVMTWIEIVVTIGAVVTQNLGL